MSLDMKIESKKLGLRDVVYIVGLVFSLSGMYYSLDGRITMTEKVNADLKAEQVGMKQIAKQNGKTLEVIYFGLVAKGIIDPPSH